MNRSSILWTVIMMCAGLCGGRSVSADDLQQAPSSPSSSDAFIQPGDSVAIEVVGYAEFNTTSTVLPDGTIFIPLVGNMPVAGLTETQLQEQLRLKLSEYINGDIKLITAITRAADAPTDRGPSDMPRPVQQAPSSISPVRPVISQMPATPTSVYIIRPKDSIGLDVWGYSEFNTTAIVSPEGIINVPLIGNVQAAGLTEAQLQEELRLKLSAYVKGNIRLTTILTRAQLPILARAQEGIAQVDPNTTITVLGAIARQNSYQTEHGLPLLDVLSIAGGTTPESDLRRIAIVSTARETRVVDLSKTMKEGNQPLLPVVYPGDTVFIPHKKHRFQNFLTIFSTTLSTTTAFLLFLRLR